ncbi:unnamed protein product, partial [Vitis vinifera]
MFKFLKPSVRPQPVDIQAAAAWGVAGVTTALYLVQPFDWLKKTFLEKPDPEEK